MSVTVQAPALPRMPWREKPADCVDVVWRHDANPIVGRHPHPHINEVCNSAVVPWRDGFAGVFRCGHRTGLPFLHAGFSRDGLSWDIQPGPIRFASPPEGLERMEYAYDPRVTAIDGTHYIQWCNAYHGPTIGLATTKDFETFHQLENAFLPCNRNGVLFPRRIGGRFAMLSRPSDNGHTPFGDVFYSESPDLTFWGRHRHVIAPGPEWWQGVKVGGGPTPIETSAGWLVFYHGVCGTCSGFNYSMGAMLLDLDRPWKVLRRGRAHILTAEADYETRGLVANVVFPVAALVDGPTGRVAIYYGAADTCVALAYTTVDAVLAFLAEFGGQDS